MALEFELVVPAYNEAATLGQLIDRAVAAAQNQGMGPDRFQLVIVDNGSTDETRSVLQALKGSDRGAWFRSVPIPVNQGYGFGVWSGLTATTAPSIGWSHADLQCDPADAFAGLRLLRTERGDRTVVKGVRHGRDWKDVVVSRVFEAFATLLLGMTVHEINAQPKVFSRRLLQFVATPRHDFAFDIHMLFTAQKHGFRIKTVPVKFPPRVHGVSKWAATFLGRFKTILAMIAAMWDIRRREGPLFS